MSSSALHSRHLMMWRIFAPKLIFEGIAFAVVTIPSLLLGTAFVFRMKNVLKIKHVRPCRHTSQGKSLTYTYEPEYYSKCNYNI